jgi:hypothetical protein
MAALNPGLRGAGYNYWADVATLLDDRLLELPRWLLGSGARAAQIAAAKDPGDPLAAQHLAVDALVHRRPPAAVDEARFAKMTPWGQAVTAFHHCLAGDARGAWALLRAMRPADPGLQSWAAGACAQD